jgi:chromosome segregation ATPase
MDKEINLLETKLNLLVNKIDTLKKENLDMKPALHRAEEEVLLLKAKINEATIKIENLLAQIPDSTI